MIRRVHLRAPAKVNLRLEVLGKREDGYHWILTWIYPISLWDEVIVERTEEGVEVRCEPEIVPLEENLCFKAATAFFARGYGEGGVKVFVRKRIPMGAGLGGGSSDAAATLKALSLLWPHVGNEDLMALGARVGADVPFFLIGKGAVMGGIGEKVLSFLPPLRRWILLVVPEGRLSPKEVYSRGEWGLTSGGVNTKIFTIPDQLSSFLRNDLEEVAARLYHPVKEIKEMLRRAGAEGVSMTGSGTGVFGTFLRKEEAERAKEGLSSKLEAEIYLVRPL